MNTNPYGLFQDIANTVTSTGINALQSLLPVVLPVAALLAGVTYIWRKFNPGRFFKG
jgi:Na+/H+-dicarboxylate symporter